MYLGFYLDVLALFGADQFQNRSQAGSVVLHLRVVHFLLVASVNFIAHYCQDDVFGAVGLQFLDPFLHDFV